MGDELVDQVETQLLQDLFPAQLAQRNKLPLYPQLKTKQVNFLCRLFKIYLQIGIRKISSNQSVPVQYALSKTRVGLDSWHQIQCSNKTKDLNPRQFDKRVAVSIYLA